MFSCAIEITLHSAVCHCSIQWKGNYVQLKYTQWLSSLCLPPCKMPPPLFNVYDPPHTVTLFPLSSTLQNAPPLFNVYDPPHTVRVSHLYSLCTLTWKLAVLHVYNNVSCFSIQQNLELIMFTTQTPSMKWHQPLRK